MGQDPSDIREAIEETRQRMGDTVDALSYKTDVRARTFDHVTHTKDAIVQGMSDAGSRRRLVRMGASVGIALLFLALVVRRRGRTHK